MDYFGAGGVKRKLEDGGQDYNSCRDFRNGNCHRGMNCKFTHVNPDGSAPDPAQAFQQAQPQACRDFLLGRCQRMGSCKFLHDSTGTLTVGGMGGVPSSDICRDAQSGRCTRGSNCRYSHAGQETVPQLQSFYSGQQANQGYDTYNQMYQQQQNYYQQPQQQQPQQQQQQVQWGVSGFPQQQQLYGSGFGGSSQPCRDFSMGKCERGMTCKFSHGAAAAHDTSNQPCRDFMSGKCERGPGCKFAHVEAGVLASQGCRDYQTGRCDRGMNCRYSHTIAPEGVEGQQQYSTPVVYDNGGLAAPGTEEAAPGAGDAAAPAPATNGDAAKTETPAADDAPKAESVPNPEAAVKDDSAEKTEDAAPATEDKAEEAKAE